MGQGIEISLGILGMLETIEIIRNIRNIGSYENITHIKNKLINQGRKKKGDDCQGRLDACVSILKVLMVNMEETSIIIIKEK